MLPVVALEVLYPKPDASNPNAVKKIAAFQPAVAGAGVLIRMLIVAATARSATTATTAFVEIR